MVYNFVFGLFGTKRGSIFLGLNVSCETSVRCHVCDFAVCIKTREFSRDEIKSDLDIMSRSFFLSFSEILDLCTQSAHVACLWLFAFLYEKETWRDMWQRILQGTRRKEKRALMDVCGKTSKLAIMSTANALWDQIGGIFSWSGIFTAREGAKNRLRLLRWKRNEYSLIPVPFLSVIVIGHLAFLQSEYKPIWMTAVLITARVHV